MSIGAIIVGKLIVPSAVSIVFEDKVASLDGKPRAVLEFRVGLEPFRVRRVWSV